MHDVAASQDPANQDPAPQDPGRAGRGGRRPATRLLPRTAEPDGDTDGMPDAWETFFGLNPASNTTRAAIRITTV